MSRDKALQAIEDVYAEIREDIFAYCDFLGFKPWSAQTAILQAVQDAADGKGPPRIAVKSGQGGGKTSCAGVVGTWRLIRYKRNLVIVTAPSMKLCTSVFLSECKNTIASAPQWFQDLFDFYKTSVTVAGKEDWQIEAITATKIENMQGRHRPHGMTVIYDEASGIDRKVFEALKGTQTGQDTLQFVISNPTLRDCELFDCFNKNAHMWAKFTINCEDAPDNIVNKENLRAMKEEFGEDSDVYRVRVKGEFPLADPDCVISSDDLYKVAHVHNPNQPHPSYYRALISRRDAQRKPAMQFGIDLARMGSDESVIYQRQGDAIVRWRVFARTEPTSVVMEAMRWQLESEWSSEETVYVVDAGGMGQGVLGILYAAGKNVHEFHTQGVPRNTRYYENKMAEAWFGFAKKVKSKTPYIPNDPLLIQQLSSRLYHMNNKKARFELETKDQYKLRTERSSPDRADALCMAFYDDFEMKLKHGALLSDQPTLGEALSR